MAELTPMMQQYLQTKEQNPDCLLFFRLGDFYEMFGDDARTASKELDLTLTSRDHDKTKAAEDKVPMCGVPYHSAESYIARLVARGYRVAICEQMEDPALAKGLVKREIVRIVTPGTVTESSMLEEARNNYFACLLRRVHRRLLRHAPRGRGPGGEAPQRAGALLALGGAAGRIGRPGQGPARGAGGAAALLLRGGRRGPL